jgi:hypothetical protein
VSSAAARAQTDDASSSAAALRAQADNVANQYFDALNHSQELDAKIASNEQLVAQLEVKEKQARADAREHALLAYMSAGFRFDTFVDASDTLDAARRAHLIDQVNATDQAAYKRLRAATQDLDAQRQALDDERTEEAAALDQLQAEGRDLDAKLAQAQQIELAAAQSVSGAGPAATAATTAPAATATTSPASADAPATTAPPATTTTLAAPPAPTPPSGYQGTPGANPHHDDPFLTCVRQRESGGNYSAVNPAGPYLGAYQFLEATWNAGANHDGRSDLVGVPANLASPYDQDEVAWAVYQWQGMAPWGGSCP